MVSQSAAVYPMAVTERLTGLTRRQIRYYERQGLLTVERTDGNQRLYAPTDIERLLRIKTLLTSLGSLTAVRRRLAVEAAATATSPRVNVGLRGLSSTDSDASRHSDAATRFPTVGSPGAPLRLGQDERLSLRPSQPARDKGV